LAPLAEKGFVPTNRMRDLDRSIATAELDIEAIDSEIAAEGGLGGSEGMLAALKAQRAELTQRIATINESIARTPQVESELGALNRNYENLRAEYRQAQARLADAATGERLEVDRQAERFEIIEQATVPQSPTRPNKSKIVMAGTFVAGAVGVGAVVLAELLDKSIRTVSDLEKRLKLRPIGTIPYVSTTVERRRRRLRVFALLLLGVAAVAATLILVHLYYLPLDVLSDKIAQRIGLL
jgi:uncharacterized protein involved in exopolysaccharide biosynthesis